MTTSFVYEVSCPMRLLRPFVVVFASAMVVALAACSGSSPGWTYAPPPSPTAAPSVVPSGSASAAPSGSAAAGAGISLEASGVQYVEASLNAPAGQPFQINFDNQDSGIPHNVQIKDGSSQMVFTGDTVTGPGKITYNVPALAAGTYKFNCKWHPNMVGDLTTK